jgi:peptidyl-prolyl cis-trans isomerase A (cyclophilin A)
VGRDKGLRLFSRCRKLYHVPLSPEKRDLKLMRTRLLYLLLAGLLGLAASASASAETLYVLIKTSKGEIELALDADKAPQTVENFLRYVDEGFYDGTIFHRVMYGFMIQGGGFTPDLEKKKTHAPVRSEANNGLKNKRGTIAMARLEDPHSATAQFFINQVDNTGLDYPDPDGWGYTVFGRVTKGLGTVDKIADAYTGSRYGMNNVPLETVTIKSITRIKHSK